jgi:hypothetical protein
MPNLEYGVPSESRFSHQEILGLNLPGLTKEDQAKIEQAAKDTLKYSQPRNYFEHYVRQRGLQALNGEPTMTLAEAETEYKQYQARMAEKAHSFSPPQPSFRQDPPEVDPNPTQIFKVGELQEMLRKRREEEEKN